MPGESEHQRQNAFTADFLDRLDESGEPDGAHEADVAGPWAVRPVPYLGGTGFAVVRDWEGEGADAGDLPYAVFRRRDMALLAAAVLPATGRERLFRLETEADAHGFPLVGLRPLPAAGHLRDFDEALADALHLVAALVRSPVALAALLEAAGHVALAQAGRILYRRIRPAGNGPAA